MSIDFKYPSTSGAPGDGTLQPTIVAGTPSNRQYNADTVPPLQLPAFAITGTGTITIDFSCVVGSGTFATSQTGSYQDVLTITGDLQSTSVQAAAIWFKPAPGSTDGIEVSATIYDNVTGTTKGVTIAETVKVVNSKLTSEGKKASTTVTVGGSTGSIQVLAQGLAISGVVPYATSLDATVTAIVASINGKANTPAYTATKINGTSFKLEAALGLGSSANGFTVSGTVTGNMTISASPMTGGINRIMPETTLANTLLNGALKLLPTVGAATGGLLLGQLLANMNKAQVTVAVADASEEPEVAVVYQGFMLPIPVGYTPPVRTGTTWSAAVYPASWDGVSFQATPVYTTNVAWCALELIRNKRWGCGRAFEWMSAAQWKTLLLQLYECSKVCDELVADGYGGLEPRYQLNVMINNMTRIEALNAVLSAMFAQPIFSDDGFQVSQDRARSPKMLVTHCNVIGGDFYWSGGALASVSNYVEIQWNNPAKYYAKEYLAVMDVQSILAVGEQRKALAAFGVTTEGQARRFGKYTQLNESANPLSVTYTAGFDHAYVLPGDLVAICDWSNPKLNEINFSGYLTAVNSTTSFGINYYFASMPSGTNYLHCMLPNGTFETRQITSMTPVSATSSGTQTTIGIASAFSTTPSLDAVFFVTQTANLNYQSYAVVSIAEQDDGTYAVSAVKYDPDKYAKIDAL